MNKEHKDAYMWLLLTRVHGADRFDFSDKLTFLDELDDLKNQLK